ncbi:MAG: aminoglycoside phosphotransferase family protein [Novosphingobium sp.]|uniref:aminoglycoside phosphotransferase family protein n=1 Tax=Novosphingobium sp. TaxID=1874826 RepID=UPI003B9C117A
MDLTIPSGVETFLTQAGWGGAVIEPLPGDASFRRYFRIRRSNGNAMLMHAPPPNEDPQPFLRAAKWLDANGLRAPLILAEDAEQGFVLLEDFGEVRMREYLDAWPQDEDEVYRNAIDALVQLRKLPPGPFTGYTLAEYQREAQLFIDWYVPTRGLYVDGRSWSNAWEEVISQLLPRQRPGVTVLRDYHAENVMLLGGLEKQGLLDFQDALAGHPAYDLVSLLQDARRDVSPDLEARMLDYYLQQTGEGEDFLADYARLGAQRNAKIVGIFVRLWKRDGKPRYLDYIPRVWALMERDLAHPALAPVARWFDEHIPADLRAAGGGKFEV